MKPSNSRHFPYQHPTFGRANTVRHEDSWKKTIYYVWWAYLKRNEKYLETCEKNGRGELSKLYKDFGDVRGNSFKTWWTSDKRGEKLFSEPHKSLTVEVIDKSDASSINDDSLLIKVPLGFPKKNILQNIRKILNDDKRWGRGKQYARQDRGAKYLFKGQPKVDALLITLMIYDKAKENPTMKLWELGRFLPQFDEILKDYLSGGKPPDTVDKKLIEATVSRYKRKANQSIKNVAYGVFP